MRLFALSGSDALARSVADAMRVELDALEEREFDDGEFKSRPLVSVRNEDVYVLHTLHGDDGRSPAERLMRLLFFLGACRDNGAARLTAVVPYLAFLRKDQQTQPRDPVNSRYVAQLFEAVGTDMIVTLEVHNLAAFQNACRRGSTHLDTAHLFVPALRDLAGEARVVFVSPDSGGVRRAEKLRRAFEAETGRSAGFAMMEKHRGGGVVSGELFAGDVAGAVVFVVDDMIATGGTMLRAARACRARGAGRIVLVAAHGLFAPESAALFSATEVDAVLVTDSVPAAPADVHGGKLTVIGCGTMIGDAIQRLHAGGSIHRLLSPLP